MKQMLYEMKRDFIIETENNIEQSTKFGITFNDGQFKNVLHTLSLFLVHVLPIFKIKD